MSLENHFKQPIENTSFKDGENTGPKLSFIEKTNQMSGELTSECNEIPPDRTYNLCVVIKLAFMAAMGGFLFGYDTGGAGGAILFLERDFPHITDEEKELIISITAIGGAIGSLTVGTFSDKYGRRICIIISDFLFMGGSFWLYAAPSIPFLIIGRFILGLGVGATCMIIPVYLAEVSPKMIRGSMVTFNIICVCVGQIFAYLFCMAVMPHWRLMFGFGAIPAILQMIAMMFINESPKFLIKAGKKGEAVKIMKNIYDMKKPHGIREMEGEVAQMEEELKMEYNGTFSQNLGELFSTYRPIVIVGVMLQVFQQFGGINTAMYYGPEMMKKAGFGKENEEISTLLASLPLACIDFVGTCIACVIVDKYGRRWSMLRMLPGAAFGMLSLGVGLYIHSIPELENEGKWVSCFALFIYLGFFSVGMNGQPWLVNSEIYPMHLRGLGNALAATGNWISDYILTMIFLSATSSLFGEMISYFIIAVIDMLAFWFIYKNLPETKGKSLQEIISLFVPMQSRENHSISRKLLTN